MNVIKDKDRLKVIYLQSVELVEHSFNCAHWQTYFSTILRTGSQTIFAGHRKRHFSSIFFWLLKTNPLPQHRLSQESEPVASGEHWRPRVSRQKSDFFLRKSSLSLATICEISSGSPLVNRTRAAVSYLRARSRATSFSAGAVSQQVFCVQDPDWPWHLHNLPVARQAEARPTLELCISTVALALWRREADTTPVNSVANWPIRVREQGPMVPDSHRRYREVTRLAEPSACT